MDSLTTTIEYPSLQAQIVVYISQVDNTSASIVCIDKRMNDQTRAGRQAYLVCMDQLGSPRLRLRDVSLATRLKCSAECAVNGEAVEWTGGLDQTWGCPGASADSVSVRSLLRVSAVADRELRSS